MLDSEEEEASELEGQAEALIVFKFHSSMLNKTLQLRSTVASWRSKIICVPRTSSTATFFYTTSQVRLVHTDGMMEYVTSQNIPREV